MHVAHSSRSPNAAGPSGAYPEKTIQRAVAAQACYEHHCSNYDQHDTPARRETDDTGTGDSGRGDDNPCDSVRDTYRLFHLHSLRSFRSITFSIGCHIDV